MPIQVESPATFVFNFRHLDESGSDLGPLDLNDVEYDPIQVVLRKPSGSLITITEGEMTVTNAASGVAQWTAPAGTIDEPGTWKAQAWAGEWPSRVLAFKVLGPNLV